MTANPTVAEGVEFVPNLGHNGKLSQLTVTTNNPHDQERLNFANYTQLHSHYSKQMQQLYSAFHRANQDFFEGRLKIPHIFLGRTASRRFTECTRITGWGAQMQYTIHRGLVDAADSHPMIRRPIPAPGTLKFLEDVVLHLVVRHFVLEQHGSDEGGYRGYGPIFTQEANRINAILGLPDVVARRRERSNSPAPVACHWPWAVRPENYYEGDVALHQIRELAGPTLPPDLGIYQYFLHLQMSDPSRLRRILEEQIDFRRLARSPALRAVEDGRQNWDGTPVSPVEWEKRWGRWNGGSLPLMAQHIIETRDWMIMPIVGDAFQDAGCDNPFILSHCSHPAQHTRNCWVLQGILKLAESDG